MKSRDLWRASMELMMKMMITWTRMTHLFMWKKWTVRHSKAFLRSGIRLCELRTLTRSVWSFSSSADMLAVPVCSKSRVISVTILGSTQDKGHSSVRDAWRHSLRVATLVATWKTCTSSHARSNWKRWSVKALWLKASTRLKKICPTTMVRFSIERVPSSAQWKCHEYWFKSFC